MTTPRLPDSPGFESLSALIPAQRTAGPVVGIPAQRPAPVSGGPARRVAPAPGSSGVEATVRVPAQRASTVMAPSIPAQRQPVAPETVTGTPLEAQVLSPSPAAVGRDTRLAVLWTLLGATTGVALLVAVVVLLPLI